MNTFLEYCKSAETTAIYPKDTEREYLYLGLDSELGEISGKIKKHLRDKTPYEQLRLDLKKEIGDCFWYFGMLVLRYYNGDIVEANFPLKDLGIPVAKATELGNDIEPILIALSTVRSINDCLIGFFTTFTCSYLPLSEEARTVFYHKAFLCLSMVCKAFGFTVKEVLQANLDKLAKRKVSNTLAGSGDDR